MIVIVTDRVDKTSEVVYAYLKSFCADVNFYICGSSHSDTEKLNELLSTTRKKYAIWMWRGLLLNSCLRNENLVLNCYFANKLYETGRCLANLNNELNHNKHRDIELALSVGLKVPRFHIVSTKNEVLKILRLNPNKEFISKTLCNPHKVEVSGGFRYYGKAVKVVEEDVASIPEFLFQPSILQEMIIAEFEVRSLVFGKTIYSMAIVKMKGTKYDNYKEDENNRSFRFIPFTLPLTIKRKVLAFMELSNTNFGSLDFLIDSSDNIFFLEMNPVGQFGWMSKHCNYSLEKKIAKYLYELQK